MPTLHWLSRDQDLTASSRVPYRLLDAVPELSYGDPATENMLIQGDNLDALKALLPVYAGRVKCIFIDPPYNTRTAFEQYDDNLEHTKWLAMMYPRLQLLRDFLNENGSIWVTIDDNEAHYLKVLMDEIFGRKTLSQVSSGSVTKADAEMRTCHRRKTISFPTPQIASNGLLSETSCRATMYKRNVSVTPMEIHEVHGDKVTMAQLRAVQKSKDSQ